jgi:gliding motility-associated-like protein
MMRKILGILTILLLNGSDLLSATYHVNSVTGSDLWNGTTSVFTSGQNGPKETMNGGISVASDGDTIEVFGNFRTEPVNNDKSLVFKFLNKVEMGDFVMDCSTGKTIFIGEDAFIGSALNLINGILEPRNKLKIYPGGFMAGGSTTSYVDGFIYMGKSNVNQVGFNFPVGNNGNFRPFAWFMEQSTTDSIYYGVKLVNKPAPKKAFPSGVNNKSYIHYWLTDIDGGSSPSNSSYRTDYGNQGQDDEVTDAENLTILYARSSDLAYSNLGGIGIGAPTGSIRSTVEQNDTGIITIGNLIGGSNALGSNIPVMNFDVANTCLNRVTQFFDRSFISTSSGATITSWMWDFGTGNPADVSTSKNPTFTYSATGTYNVKLVSTASNGNKDSITKSIVIGDIPLSAFTAEGSCLGDSTKFESSSKSINPIASQNWTFGNGQVLTTSDTVVKCLYASAGVFGVKLLIINEAGCMDSLIKNTTIYAKPAPSATISAQCTKDSAVFQGSGGVAGDSVVRWEWFVGSKTFDAQNFKYLYTSSQNINAKLFVTSAAGCKDSITATSTIWKSPRAVIYLDQSVSNNDSIQCFTNNLFTVLNASDYPSDQTLNVELLWGTNRVSDDNDYSFTTTGSQPVVMLISTDKGCTDSMVKTYLTTMPLPLDVNITARCLNDSVVAVADLKSILPSRITKYNWTINNIIENSTNDSFKKLIEIPGTYNLKFWADLTDGCTDTVQQAFTLTPLPSFFIDTLTPMPFCKGDSVNIGIVSKAKVFWVDGDTNSSRFFKTEGTKSFVISDTLGCQSNGSIDILIHPIPLAFAGEDTTIIRNQKFELLATGGISYAWSPTATLATPRNSKTSATPLNTTMFFVEVTDSNGCKSIDSVKVTVVLAVEYKIPNLITPNGDNMNDAWDLSGIPNIANAKISVYNTQGKLLYQANKNYDNSWEGTETNGTPLPSETYLYIIEIPNQDPKRGYLRILR